MSDLFETMLGVLKDFAHRESQADGVAGIVVFGSFAKGKVRERSDLDLLVLREDIDAYSRTTREHKGFTLEIHTWPLEVFSKPFIGESVNVFSDVFCFDVMRIGKILYDPKGLLHQFKLYAKSSNLPHSHIKSFAERACKSLHLARNLLEERRLEGAEIEVRRAAEELARAMLLQRDVLEIVSPKYYLPHLRKEAPSFYRTFREIHNLQETRRSQIESDIQLISIWHESISEQVRRIGKEDWLKLGGAIHGAGTEISNAQDCLDSDDLEAAILQTRYSALLLSFPVLRLLKGRSSNAYGTRYIVLLQSGHPYGDILTSVLDFSHDEQRVEEHIDILISIAEKYRQEEF